MRNNNTDPYNQENRSRGDRSSNEPARDRADLPDNERDSERLQSEEATIELPDVKDIPGQEFVHAPPMGAFADTTISSADEEGEGIFEDDEEDETDIVMGTTSDISLEDKHMLETSEDYLPTKDEARLIQASLDETDVEGELLNESSFGRDHSGKDLDIPEETDDTRTDAMGQGDEENKYFSLGGDDNDQNETRP